MDRWVKPQASSACRKATLLVRENGNGSPFIERCYNAVANNFDIEHRRHLECGRRIGRSVRRVTIVRDKRLSRPDDRGREGAPPRAIRKGRQKTFLRRDRHATRRRRVALYSYIGGHGHADEFCQMLMKDFNV